MHFIQKFVAAAVIMSALPIFAHEKKGEPEDRTAVMSEEVASQRLQTAGHKDVANVTRVNDTYQAVTSYNGKRILVEIDGKTGKIREKTAGGDANLPR